MNPAETDNVIQLRKTFEKIALAPWPEGFDEEPIDYGDLPPQLVEFSDQIVKCLEDCFLGERMHDRQNAVNYIAAMMRHVRAGRWIKGG